MTGERRQMNDLYSFYLFRKARIDYVCDICGKKIPHGEYYYLKKFNNKTYKGRPICQECGKKMGIKPTRKEEYQRWVR